MGFASDEGNNGEQRLLGVTKVNDNDIICGRGGLALKHPGNMAYRKIVGLNKELYATCLKTEKLRISKSIVAAIREISGRFLEREDGKTSQSLEDKDANGDPVTWKDIGDKRAVEKTSQALREGQPKLLKKLAAAQDNSNGAMQSNGYNGLPMNGQFNQHQHAPGVGVGVGVPQPQAAQMMLPAAYGHTMQQQPLPLQQVAPNNFNHLPPGVQAAVLAQNQQHQQQQLQQQQSMPQITLQPNFMAQHRPSLTLAQHRPSLTLASLVEGQAFNSFPNGVAEIQTQRTPSGNIMDPSRAGSGQESWHDSWGSAGPSPLPTPAVQRASYDRSDSKTSRDSWGEEDPVPLPYHEPANSGSSEDHALSPDDEEQLMKFLGATGVHTGVHAGVHGHNGLSSRPDNKRPSVKFQIPNQRPSMSAMSAMSLTSHLSELSIFSDALSLDSAMDAARREAEFDMLGEFDGTELMSVGTFESPPQHQAEPGGEKPQPRRSILRKSNKWTTPHHNPATAFPPAPLNNLDPGMIFTSTLDTAPGGVNSGTDVSGLLGERRKSVVAFEVDVARRRSSRMSLCSALTDFSGVYKRDIGSVLSIQSADFRELMADIDSDESDTEPSPPR